VKQRGGPATVIAAKLIELAPEICVLTGAGEFASQFFERRDESFRHVAAAELAPMAVLIRLAPPDGRSLCFHLASHGRDKFLNRVVILHTRRALNAAANVHGLWSHHCDRLTDVLRV